MMAQVGRREQH